MRAGPTSSRERKAPAHAALFQRIVRRTVRRNVSAVWTAAILHQSRDSRKTDRRRKRARCVAGTGLLDRLHRHFSGNAMVQFTLPKGSSPKKGKVWPGSKTANGKKPKRHKE